MVKIPQMIFNAYVDAANDMLQSNFGVPCKLQYTPIKTVCNNCVYDTIGHKSANRYADGGPAPFHGICPVCGGQGFIETEKFDIIKLRVYYQSKNFMKVAELVNVAQTAAQAIGSINDLHKFRNANRIIVDYADPNPETRTYERIGEYVPFGMGQEKLFFACFLKRAG